MSKSSDRGTKRPKLSPPPTREKLGEPKVKECGCVSQAYAEGPPDRFPCIPHALQEAAGALQEAGAALGYVGGMLGQQEAKIRANEAMEKLNGEVDKGIEDGNIS